MTTIEDARVITGGVDTHAGMHVAAALDSIGGLLGVQEFPATAAGYASLLSWLRSFGTLAVAGVEGTGSYGAGLARHLAAAGVRVVEVDRPDPGRGQIAGQASAVAAGALDAGQGDVPEPPEPAQQAGVPGRRRGELPRPQQPADPVKCRGDMDFGMGVHPAGDHGFFFYDGHCRPFLG